MSQPVVTSLVAGAQRMGRHRETLLLAPDLVEVLVALGRVREATAVVGRVRALAERLEDLWALATAKRCDALVRLAGGYDEDAAAALAEAAVAFAGLGLHFDRARSLLALGRIQRRHRKWGTARVCLEQAVAAFETIGASGWAEEARCELARVGPRRGPRAPGDLTGAERRVAELAAAGRSNKEIACALFVTVHTVEVHLSHAYAKLGIRSRTQLAGRLGQS